jgi:hypothetical protein
MGVDGLTTTLRHISGESISGVYPVNPVKNDPQSIGSALTYSRRYSLMAMLGIVADDDDDGNAATQPVKQLLKPKVKPNVINQNDSVL